MSDGSSKKSLPERPFALWLGLISSALGIVTTLAPAFAIVDLGYKMAAPVIAGLVVGGILCARSQRGAMSGLVATVLIAAALWVAIAVTKPNLVREYVWLNQLHLYIIESYDFFLWVVAISQGLLACALTFLLCKWLKLGA